VSDTLSSEEERDLIADLPDNPDAFRPLYRHYFTRIFAYVAYRVGGKQDAEDITAEVFMLVVEKIHQFDYRGEGSFAAWLFRIAYNRIQQFYRKSQRSTLLMLDDLPEISGDSILPDEAIIKKEQFARLQSMIASLAPRRQEVITLKYFGELKNNEIAEILELDERTVASHLSRGLDDLQEKYQKKDVIHE